MSLAPVPARIDPMLYLDHAATTPLRPEARAAMDPVLGPDFGNPSGVHGVARRAKNALEEAREQAAGLIGAARPLEVVFTGGGTEADNLALQGVALAGHRRGIVTTAIEHEAVLESGRFLAGLGCPLAIVPVAGDGVVEPEPVAQSVTADTAVVSVMAANNETGMLQPVRKIVEAVKGVDPSVAVHTDAVQAFISEETTVDTLGADLVTLASHKFGGPKGVGLLFVRDGVALSPVLHGGGQELGRRSGTHNVAGIVGMVAAMAAAVEARDRLRAEVSEARSRFERAVRIAFPDVEITGERGARLVQHSHMRIPGVEAETMLIRLDQAGVAASAGSACQSGAGQVSHVLTAMGVEPGSARQFLRFSFGWTTAAGDGDVAGGAVVEAAGGLR